MKRLAANEGVHASYISRVLRLAFLSPAMVDAILRGELPPEINVARLVAGSPSWAKQRRAFLPASLQQIQRARAPFSLVAAAE